MRERTSLTRWGVRICGSEDEVPRKSEYRLFYCEEAETSNIVSGRPGRVYKDLALTFWNCSNLCYGSLGRESHNAEAAYVMNERSSSRYRAS